MSPNQSKYDVLIKILDKMNKNLEEINVKLEKLNLIISKEALEQASDKKKEDFPALDVMTLLSLPDHLRKTAMILSRLGKATADQISKESGRVRALESAYLNQLVAMGYIKKMRKGRDVYFYVE